MKQIFVSFVDLDPDCMAHLLSAGDLWCRSSGNNVLSRDHLIENGELLAVQGEISMFSENASIQDVFNDVFLHYYPHGRSGPFSGPRKWIEVIGCAEEFVIQALQNEAAVNVQTFGNLVRITRKS